ncbi:hypothetical protein [Paenibacillus sp. Aloe-11]|uniref:hypothetical protein n=1 Tax=Paenibacillus sp. Aloe-11 TaxID=1050222 RepID=UPI0002EFC392|nr:hypothetical protein [Paenibacillus sp. Aloe-11]
MKLRIILIIMLLLTNSIFLFGCTNNNQEKVINESNKSKNTQLEYIRQVSVRENSYFIFNSHDDSPQKIKISFPYRVEGLNIKKASLLLKNEVVSDNVKIVQIHENELTVAINFIREFDAVEVVLKDGNTVRLNSGQYYFENFKEDNLNEFDKEILEVRNFHLKFKNGHLLTDIILPQDRNSKIEYLFPSQIRKYASNIKFSHQKIDDNSVKYTLEADISRDILSKNNVNSIIFDIGMIQNYKNKKWFLIKGKVPIELSDFKK